MSVSATLVKELREKTGAGVMACRDALQKHDNDVEKAASFLRQKGITQAEKKAGRVTGEGRVDAYIHQGGKLGVLLEVNCETDFVAKTDEFKALVKELAMQIAATAPRYVSRDSVPEEIASVQRASFEQAAQAEGKKPDIVARIVEGKLEKWYGEICLLDQVGVRDDSQKIGDVVRSAIAKIGENIVVKRFARFNLGE